jgi:hypothetical protein
VEGAQAWALGMVYGEVSGASQGLYARNRFGGIDNRGVVEAGVAYTAYTVPLALPHALTTEAGVRTCCHTREPRRLHPRKRTSRPETGSSP